MIDEDIVAVVEAGIGTGEIETVAGAETVGTATPIVPLEIKAKIEAAIVEILWNPEIIVK